MDLKLVFLIYGFSFLSIAIVIFSKFQFQSKYVISRLMGLLGMFGFLHGVYEWGSMWNLIQGESPFLQTSNLILLTSSFIILFEFGRRLFNSIQKKTAIFFPYYIYGIQLLMIFFAVFFAENMGHEFLIWVRYVFAFPGAILASIGFYLYYHEYVQSTLDEAQVKKMKWAFYAISLSFGLYGLFGGLIVPSGEKFPSTYINSENFLQWVGFPVQLFRAFCGAIMAMSLIQILQLFFIEQVNAIEERNKNIKDLYYQNQMILGTTMDGILFVDLLENLQFINKAGEKMLGYKSEELMGKNFHQMIHHSYLDGKDYPAENCPTAKMLQGKSGPIRIDSEVFWRKDKSSLSVEYYSVPMYENNSLKGAVVTFRDITLRKEYEQKIMEAKEKAEIANEAKSKFLANMSHELRTPLNAIIGFSDLLSESELKEDQKKSVEVISKAGESLLNIINDILDFSKLEEGKLELNPVEFRWNELMDKLNKIHSFSAKCKNIKLLFYISPSLPKKMIGDVQRIEQIYMNLISNAIKFTSSGLVSVNVDVLKFNGNEAIIKSSVVDTGIGISYENQEKLFQRFFQVDDSSSRKYHGTGLGLAIVKKIVEKMSGDICVKSDLGKGSEFSFTVTLNLLDENSI